MNEKDYIELVITNLLDEEDILTGVRIQRCYLRDFREWIEAGATTIFQGCTFVELVERDE